MGCVDEHLPPELRGSDDDASDDAPRAWPRAVRLVALVVALALVMSMSGWLLFGLGLIPM